MFSFSIEEVKLELGTLVHRVILTIDQACIHHSRGNISFSCMSRASIQKKNLSMRIGHLDILNVRKLGGGERQNDEI